MSKVPCIELTGLTGAQRRAYRLADNKLALNAGWDVDLLAAELGELHDLGFDLGTVDFSLEEIDELFAPAATEGETDPDATPLRHPSGPWPHTATCGRWGGTGCSVGMRR